MSLPSSKLDLDGKHALKLGDEIYLRHEHDSAIKTRISGFLVFGEGPDRPIVVVTGGPGKINGNAITVADEVKVGPIIFARFGLVFIRLDDDYRSYVENLVTSEENNPCHIVIHEGPPSIGEPVLAHAGEGGPLQLKIDGTFNHEEGCVQPLVNTENQSLPLGTLITKKQERGEESSRLLPAFGPVCGQQRAFDKRQAVISRIDEGIRAFKAETHDERFRGNDVVTFVTPICQPESDEEEAAGTRNVDFDGAEDGTDTSGLASSESFASLSSADQTEGAVARGGASGKGNQDRAESGYDSRNN